MELVSEEAAVISRGSFSTTKRYEVAGCIGEGGMGLIYEARDPVLDRRVALKVMKSDIPSDQRRRFRREAVFGARFCHPSIARVYDMGLLDDARGEWFSMEYLEGTDMAAVVERRIRRGEVAPLPSVVEVFRQILAALQYAHDCQVIHRDVKPANMFVTRDPNTNFVTTKLLDFGVALDLEGDGVSAETTLVGDPCYMAPEQTRLGWPVAPSADVYAAGMSLFEVLTGRHPFEDLLTAPLPEIIDAQRHRLPHPPSEFIPHDASQSTPGGGMPANVAEALDAIVLKACAKEPMDRYQSAREMQQDLLGLVR